MKQQQHTKTPITTPSEEHTVLVAKQKRIMNMNASYRFRLGALLASDK